MAAASSPQPPTHTGVARDAIATTPGELRISLWDMMTDAYNPFRVADHGPVWCDAQHRRIQRETERLQHMMGPEWEIRLARHKVWCRRQSHVLTLHLPRSYPFDGVRAILFNADTMTSESLPAPTDTATDQICTVASSVLCALG
jgi:hypothetical protein